MPSQKTPTKQKMVSFAEYRQLQRIKEDSHRGPGSTDTSKPFGSEINHKMHFGGKYTFKADSNPPVGLYEADRAIDYTRPRVQATVIKKPQQYAVYY